MEKILIRYTDIERWKGIGRRVLIYGRRKVGKSFFVKNFTKWDKYFLVKRDGGILDITNRRDVSYDYLKDVLISGKRVVVDEFHRLPEDFLDFLQAYQEDVNVILITSTLWLANKILSKDSPILGILQRFKMGLIDERDILLNLCEEMDGKELIESAVYLREAWLIPMMRGKIREEIPRIIWEEKDTIEKLIGEIFTEEERMLKKSYISILSAVANGNRVSGEIANILYSKKIIKKNDPSIIQGHLRTLINLGFLEKLKILNKKYDHYYHVSPIFDLYFYLDSKYGFSEIEIPKKMVKEVFLELLPLHVEQFFRNLLSKLFGTIPSKIIERNFDIDIVLKKFKKIVLVGEVKWVKSLDRNDLMEIEKNLRKFKNCKRILIVPDKKILPYEPKGIEVWDVNKVLEILKKGL